MHQAERELQSALASEAAAIVNSPISSAGVDPKEPIVEPVAADTPFRGAAPKHETVQPVAAVSVRGAASRAAVDNESPVVVRRTEAPLTEDAAPVMETMEPPVEMDNRAHEQVRASEWVEKQRAQVHVEKEAEQRKSEAAAASVPAGWSASLSCTYG